VREPNVVESLIRPSATFSPREKARTEVAFGKIPQVVDFV
jgi:hypothetical protein